jgi:hypothetical protein
LMKFSSATNGANRYSTHAMTSMFTISPEFLGGCQHLRSCEHVSTSI